jgi:3-oxoacyl-[acyl-carrier protein] reductase
LPDKKLKEMSVAEGSPVAIVTGGTRGIGLAIAKRLADDGYDLVLTYRGDAVVAGAARDALQSSGRRISVVSSDVSDAESAGSLIETTVNEFGRLDALINNAGITRDTLIMRMSEQDWDAVLSTNLKGAFLCSKAAIRPMLRQRAGRIVNMTSVVGLVGNAGQANYAAAKAGLVGLTKSLAKEVGSRSITVNAIAPGFIDTRLTEVLSDELKDTLLKTIPLGRFGTPEDVSGAVSFLLSRDASYITGHVLTIDGGLFMA